MNQEFESSPELCSKSISGKASQSSIKFNLLRASWNINLLYLTAQHGYTLYVDFTCPYNKVHRLYGDWDLKLTLWSLAAQEPFQVPGFCMFFIYLSYCQLPSFTSVFVCLPLPSREHLGSCGRSEVTRRRHSLWEGKGVLLKGPQSTLWAWRQQQRLGRENRWR